MVVLAVCFYQFCSNHIYLLQGLESDSNGLFLEIAVQQWQFGLVVECGEADDFHLPSVIYNAETGQTASPNDLLLFSKETVWISKQIVIEFFCFMSIFLFLTSLCAECNCSFSS